MYKRGHKRRFQFVAKEAIKKERQCTPEATKKSTKWTLNTWNEWAASREKMALGENGPHSQELEHIDPVAFSKHMCNFVQEARKLNGQIFPRDTLYGLCAGLLRYVKVVLHRTDLNFFDESNADFEHFRVTLESQMRLADQAGLGAEKKSSQAITVEQERTLWEKGLLSMDTAEGLLKAVYFYNCKCFGVRGRDEHRNAQVDQYKFDEDEEGRYIIFRSHPDLEASASEKKPLDSRYEKEKEIKQYDSEKHHSVYKIFQKYLSKIPATGSLYRHAMEPVYPGEIRFWKLKIVGTNTLSSFIRKLMRDAGFQGHYTSHSGNVTLATTLSHAGFEEQVVKERSGRANPSASKVVISNKRQKEMSRVLEPPDFVQRTVWLCRVGQSGEQHQGFVVPAQGFSGQVLTNTNIAGQVSGGHLLGGVTQVLTDTNRGGQVSGGHLLGGVTQVQTGANIAGHPLGVQVSDGHHHGFTAYVQTDMNMMAGPSMTGQVSGGHHQGFVTNVLSGTNMAGHSLGDDDCHSQNTIPRKRPKLAHDGTIIKIERNSDFSDDGTAFDSTLTEQDNDTCQSFQPVDVKIENSPENSCDARIGPEYEISNENFKVKDAIKGTPSKDCIVVPVFSKEEKEFVYVASDVISGVNDVTNKDCTSSREVCTQTDFSMHIPETNEISTQTASKRARNMCTQTCMCDTLEAEEYTVDSLE